MNDKKILEDFHARKACERIQVNVNLSHNLDEITRNAGLEYTQDDNGEVHKTWSKQWQAIVAYCHSKTAKISDYLVYELPFGIWLLAYIAAALVIVAVFV